MSEQDQEIPTDLDGWNWFNQQQKVVDDIFEKEYGLPKEEIILHFQRCFSTKSGKIVLNYLQNLQNNYKDFDPELGFYNGAAFGFWRSGQKSIIRMLQQLTKRGD